MIQSKNPILREVSEEGIDPEEALDDLDSGDYNEHPEEVVAEAREALELMLKEAHVPDIWDEADREYARHKEGFYG